jgi:hypothetical protein
MADHYTHFSFALTDLSEEEQAWLGALLDSPDDTPNEELAALLGDDEYIGFEASFEDDGRTLWVHAGESGTPERAAVVVQEFLARFRPGDAVGFEWANTCSRPLLDAFGGGAVFVTAAEQRWLSSAQWLADKLDAAATRTAAGPEPRWRFRYELRSSADGMQRVVGSGHAVIAVSGDEEPAQAAVRWVHDHDERADPRIDPCVEILEIEPADDVPLTGRPTD